MKEKKLKQSSKKIRNYEIKVVYLSIIKNLKNE